MSGRQQRIGRSEPWDAARLASLLGDLDAIGQVHLMKTDSGGWHASVKFPAPAGVRAEVCSDCDHTTPIAALQCVHDRLGGLRNMLSVPSPQPGIAHSEVST